MGCGSGIFGDAVSGAGYKWDDRFDGRGPQTGDILEW
jgi:hypothetical protein